MDELKKVICNNIVSIEKEWETKTDEEYINMYEI